MNRRPLMTSTLAALALLGACSSTQYIMSMLFSIQVYK